jgi:nitroimidazol reductase NimA-like FMN-containing flavoprotein (pyridoxamine 5'-phosphate oxidase superfamily)
MLDEGLELLEEPQCWALLAGSTVGRIAVNVGPAPAVFPVNFAVDGRAIVFRTGTGTKLTAALDHAFVSFQCDQID